MYKYISSQEYFNQSIPVKEKEREHEAEQKRGQQKDLCGNGISILTAVVVTRIFMCEEMTQNSTYVPCTNVNFLGSILSCTTRYNSTLKTRVKDTEDLSILSSQLLVTL